MILRFSNTSTLSFIFNFGLKFLASKSSGMLTFPECHSILVEVINVFLKISL